MIIDYHVIHDNIIPASLQIYYRNAIGAIFVFDITNLSTFKVVQFWKAELDENIRLPNGKPLPAVLLANKVRERKSMEAERGNPPQSDTIADVIVAIQ
jgi:GTPase SAR1 family protein